VVELDEPTGAPGGERMRAGRLAQLRLEVDVGVDALEHRERGADLDRVAEELADRPEEPSLERREREQVAHHALADTDREERLRHAGAARDDADGDDEQRELDEQSQIHLSVGREERVVEDGADQQGFATPRPDATRIVTTITAIVRR
jgi:hypothetical protein